MLLSRQSRGSYAGFSALAGCIAAWKSLTGRTSIM
jgi:hypothetical protein